MSDTIPVAQLRAFVERIERIEADIKDLNSDKSEVYKELRGCGFDVKAVRAVVAKRKLDTADREERDAMFDLYWSALNGEDRARAHAREIIEEFDAETGEITDNQEHASDCAVHNEPAFPAGACDCGTRSGASTEVRDTDAVSPPAGNVEGFVSAVSPASDESEAPADRDAGYMPTCALTPRDDFTVGTLSHSQASSVPADSAGEAPSSSPASPATLSDDIDLTIPDFLRRTEGGYPNREAVEA